jgi:hypothetical protein
VQAALMATAWGIKVIWTLQINTVEESICKARQDLRRGITLLRFNLIQPVALPNLSRLISHQRRPAIHLQSSLSTYRSPPPVVRTKITNPRAPPRPPHPRCCPLFARKHGDDKDEGLRSSPWISRFDLVSRADVVVATSRSEAETGTTQEEPFARGRQRGIAILLCPG